MIAQRWLLPLGQRIDRLDAQGTGYLGIGRKQGDGPDILHRPFAEIRVDRTAKHRLGQRGFGDQGRKCRPCGIDRHIVDRPGRFQHNPRLDVVQKPRGFRAFPTAEGFQNTQPNRCVLI